MATQTTSQNNKKSTFVVILSYQTFKVSTKNEERIIDFGNCLHSEQVKMEFASSFEDANNIGRKLLNEFRDTSKKYPSLINDGYQSGIRCFVYTVDKDGCRTSPKIELM